jgi:8-oxo-dGTP pyrophosphatase MutT (NUDIX family)
MVREISSGGVVVRRRDGRWWMAAIEPQMSGAPAPRRKPVLALPKGLVEPGERPEATALRETREETGVQATLVRKLADIRYIYVRSWGDRERVFKIVSFYLLAYRSGRLGRISPEMRIEVRRAEWIPLEEGPRRLTYPGEQRVARLAIEHLQGLLRETQRAGGEQHSAAGTGKPQKSKA